MPSDDSALKDILLALNQLKSLALSPELEHYSDGRIHSQLDVLRSLIHTLRSLQWTAHPSRSNFAVR